MLDQFIGKVLAEKYRLEGVLRDADLGRLYHATHLLMEKRVAVKVLAPALAVDENIVAQFSVEARRISNISHPNILNVTDFGSDTDGTVFIVYDSAEGETLKEILARGDLFPADRAVGIVKQIANGLSSAHLKGVVHGNLRSENILLGDEDAVKILDLGTGKADEPLDEEVSAEKIRYLSPEQCADSSNVDERSDIYALGVIFYEMLAGEVPFKAETTGELMMKHAQEPPPPLSSFRQDLPPEIEPVILQTLAKNPEMRHQTAAELIDDLNRASRQIGFAPKTAQAAAGSPNNLWKTAFVVLAGISLLSVGLIWATSSKQTDPSTYLSDANAQPVQPINPATGMNEQGLSNMVQMQSALSSNSNMVLTMPDTLGGGASNPLWERGYIPDGPVQMMPTGGNTVTVGPCDPNNPFMPCDTIVVTQPVNSNVNTQVAPSPKPTKSPNANVSASPTPQTTESPKPQTSPTPAVTPAVKTEKTPAVTKPPTKPSPEKTPPASTKKIESGKNQES